MNKIKTKVNITTEEFQNLANKPVPSAEELIERLTKWHSFLYDAFSYALPRAREVLKQAHCKSAAKWFRPQIIRFYVNDFLHQKEIKTRLVDANDDDENNESSIFEPRVLASNGIAGNIYGFEFRILKIYKGGLPPPVTARRKEFYNQPHLEGYQSYFPDLVNDATYKRLVKPNLVYLWELFKNTYNLYLAIPKHSLLYAETRLTLIRNPITLLKQKESEEKDSEEIQNDNIIEVDNSSDIRRTNKTGSGI